MADTASLRVAIVLNTMLITAPMQPSNMRVPARRKTGRMGRAPIRGAIRHACSEHHEVAIAADLGRAEPRELMKMSQKPESASSDMRNRRCSKEVKNQSVTLCATPIISGCLTNSYMVPEQSSAVVHSALALELANQARVFSNSVSESHRQPSNQQPSCAPFPIADS